MARGLEIAGQDEMQEIERHRYNVAFDELGLGWYWDEQTYAELQSTIHADRSPVHVYVERHVPHLLRAYDSHFLVDAVEGKKMQRDAESND